MIPTKISTYHGVAVQTNMGDNDIELEVFVPEFLPMGSGTISSDPTPDKYTVSVDNQAVGGLGSAIIDMGNSVKCHYYGSNTNHSIPNIHIGEQVLVICIGDSSEFFWKELGRHDDRRTTEHLKLHVSNKPDQTDELTDDTSYFIEMDTREGNRKIHIHTSAGTEEEVTYDIKIDTDKSEVSLVDSIGNGWILRSNDRYIKTYNESGSFIEIDKENIHQHAVDTHKITCKHHVVEAEEDIKTVTKVTLHDTTESLTTNTKTTVLNTTDSLTTNTKATVLNSSDSVDVNTAAHKLAASASDETTTASHKVTATGKSIITAVGIDLMAPVVQCQAALLVGASIGAGGGVGGTPTMTMSGSALSMTGSISTTAGLSTDAAVTAASVDATGNISAGGTVVGTNVTAEHLHTYGNI